VARRIVRRLYFRRGLLLFEIDLPAASEDAGFAASEPRGPDGVRIVPFRGPWTRLEVLPGPVSSARLAEWSLGGMTCLLAERGDAPVGYVWVDPGVRRARYSAAPDLPSDAVLVRNLYVLAADRGQGIGTALVAAAVRHAAAGGFRRARYTVRPDNQPSRRAFATAAGHPPRLLGELVYLRILDRVRRSFVPA
jgi:ribosomal protein S18 acetylase RimI-like enzyme